MHYVTPTRLNIRGR